MTIDPRAIAGATIGLLALYGASLLDARAWPLRAVCAFPLIFLLPGAIYPLSFMRAREKGLTVILLSGVVIQYCSLLAVTTVFKAAGITIGPLPFLAAELSLCVPAFAMAFRAPPTEAAHDVNLAVLVPVCVSIAAVGIIHRSRLTLGIDDYWLGERIESIRWGERSCKGVSVVGREGLAPGGGRSWKITAADAIIHLENRSGRPVDYHLLYFVRGSGPGGTITLSLNGAPVASYELPQGFYKARHNHVFGPQCVISEWIRPMPGDNRLRISFRGFGGATFSGDLQDFSGMTEEQFIRSFRKRNGILNIGHMYDIREIATFGGRLRDKLYLWGDRFSTGGREGYICISVPASHFQDMFILAALGRFPLSLHIAFFIRLAILALALTHLAERGLVPIGGWGAIAFSAVAVAYTSVGVTSMSDIFPDTFLLMAFFASLVFLIQRYDRLWLLASLMTALSRPQAVALSIVSLIAYGLIFREGKKVARLLAVFGLALVLFATMVFAIGLENGLLGIWKKEIRQEHFSKSLDEVPPGFTALDNLRNLIVWLLFTSCFIPLGVRFAGRDRIVRFCMAILAVYLAHLVLFAGARVYRVHYIAAPIFLFLLWYLRGLCLAECGRIGRRRLLPVFTALLAAGTAFYLIAVPFDYPRFNSPFLSPQLHDDACR